MFGTENAWAEWNHADWLSAFRIMAPVYIVYKNLSKSWLCTTQDHLCTGGGTPADDGIKDYGIIYNIQCTVYRAYKEQGI